MTQTEPRESMRESLAITIESDAFGEIWLSRQPLQVFGWRQQQARDAARSQRAGEIEDLAHLAPCGQQDRRRRTGSQKVARLRNVVEDGDPGDLIVAEFALPNQRSLAVTVEDDDGPNAVGRRSIGVACAHAAETDRM